MLSEKDKLEYEVLKIIAGEGKPLGSGLISQSLAERGYVLSEATAGRFLSELDRKGLTQKVGFQGRLISLKGQQRLTDLQLSEERSKYGFRFLNSLDSKGKDDLIEILVARRAMERELARLAAINATESQIKLLKKIYHEQERYVSRNLVSAEQDIRFHRVIAYSAKNKVLAAALDLIRQNSQLTPVLEHIRTKVEKRVAVEHAKILQAIEARNPEEADRAMVEHLESLVRDVVNYWAQAKGKI
ncbi:MAG: FCD domain-containing protein [Syntrophomonadaceae bacterium]|nr:FCD domain-containing protein [Syntrophomonadaceae bacterium]